jgi:ATP synthase F1 epsilon subunit
MTLTVKLITPEKTLPVVEADHVTLPAFDGEVGIRTGHAAYVCQLGIGQVRVKSNTKADQTFLIRGGVAQVINNEVRILAESVSEGVDEARLVKQIQDLASQNYDDPVKKAEARATANWAVAQLKHLGKQVPPEASQLGL